MAAIEARPLVGVGVFIVEDGRILLGQRRGSHGAGSWALPGGHLEWGETPEDCARREVLEETGLELAEIRRGPFTNDVFPEGKHYVTLFLVTRRARGEVKLLEPQKCERWEWCSWSALPSPLFLPLENLRKTAFNPVE
jgi:8-oxo-dGTP diphosphatase